MAKRTEDEPREHDGGKAKDFVKKNWPVALLVTGGVVAGAVWLTAKYLRYRKERQKNMDILLRQVQDEATTVRNDPTSVILESGSHLAGVAGSEVKIATDEITEHIDDPNHKQIFDTLGNVAQLEANARQKGKQGKS